jgi:hypothetical protein
MPSSKAARKAIVRPMRALIEMPLFNIKCPVLERLLCSNKSPITARARLVVIGFVGALIAALTAVAMRT